MIRAVALTALTALAGCAELKELREPPAMTSVRPEMTAHAFAVDTEPTISSGSTWRPKRSNLYANSVALDEGDLLTISISINDRAKLLNKSDRQRTAGRTLNGNAETNLFGPVVPKSGTARVDSTTSFDGEGRTTRSETVSLSIAAIVVERFPNGTLVIDGRQEVRVNDELRLLRIQGIVRQSDIGPDNVVSYERIAEARISYGGRGPVAEVQRPPYGQRLVDHLSPF